MRVKTSDQIWWQLICAVEPGSGGEEKMRWSKPRSSAPLGSCHCGHGTVASLGCCGWGIPQRGLKLGRCTGSALPPSGLGAPGSAGHVFQRQPHLSSCTTPPGISESAKELLRVTAQARPQSRAVGLTLHLAASQTLWAKEKGNLLSIHGFSHVL